jgi:uncharacterized protein (DUF2345 family)
MNTQSALDCRPSVQTLPLVAAQQLVLERARGGDRLSIVAADGQVRAMIEISADGAVLRLGGEKLTIQTEGALAIDAQRVAIHARQGMALTTGGDLVLRADGDVHSNARVQNITADLGDVKIKANDDVRLNGERVRSNCT